ncbi:hypothetical protein GGR57DRAFT_512483 [Xylariaceae sp. FL1272]|nr:hypothetical protein GGR57DRAFT_512483 [Xylariaceae sp. FL1272]
MVARKLTPKQLLIEHIFDMSSSFDPSIQAFESAKKRLKNRLRDDTLFNDLATTSIDHVWETVKEVQKKPYAEQRMRHLGKIGGFLAKLEAYAATIDTFVQVKPDVLALIWGPIRILLVWTQNVARFADDVCAVMEKVGDALPHFIEVVKIFTDCQKLNEVLGLFYGDILDFYVIVLEVFNLSRLKLIYESIWPRRIEKINVVVQNLEKHTTLFRNEVTLQHIRAEAEARTNVMKQFDQTRDFEHQRKFEALRTQISPQTYYDRLDRLLNRSCGGAAEWLLNDLIFSEWLDFKSTATPLLWLYGIPGAGKTFLTAAALEKIRIHENVLFVFASHMHQENTTARSILLSLIFQLSSEFKDAQAVLVESNARQLAGSTKYVSELFQTLLAVSGPTYIVVDGLDEIEAVERKLLLQHLVDIVSCPAIRVLLSSRPEDDITSILTTKATGIRVDERNSGSILTYVQQELDGWMTSRDFDHEAQDKIRRLLAPIATTANGMFLYVKIVLDNVKQLTSIEEIERELTVLPVDLNDAYGRIFSKINKLQPPALRRKARTLLGWIGCAPIPMTKYEMEQALLVDSECNPCPCVIAPENFIRMCGPILEIVDEVPQFVHFTAKEYIFGQSIEGSVQEGDARYGLTMSILSYLSSGIFRPNVSDEQLQTDLLAGKYRLQSFASSQIAALVTRCARDSQNNTPVRARLNETLLRVFQELKNDNFERDESESVFLSPEIYWGDASISDTMGCIWRFRQDDRQSDWTFENRNDFVTDSSWANLDPLILSAVMVQTFNKLEKLLCVGAKHEDGCFCKALQKHYGTYLFKCKYPGCGISRPGFRSRQARNAHLSLHSRPWKCSVSSCLYADVGFTTERDMYNHRDKEHASAPPPVQDRLPLGELSRDDLELVLLECTHAQRLDQIRQILLYLDSKRMGISLWSARNLAVKMGSLEMVKILMEPITNPGCDRLSNFTGDPNMLLFSRNIAQGSNVALLRWLLDTLHLIEDYCPYRLVTSCLLKNDSDDIYAAWEEFVLSPTGMVKGDVDFASSLYHPDDFRPAKELIPLHNKRSLLFSMLAFNATRGSAMRERRLIQTWNKLILALGVPMLNSSFLGWSLTELGKSSGSVRLAEELLRLGAPIDFPGGKGKRVIPNQWPQEPRQNISKRRRGIFSRGPKAKARQTYGGRTSLHNAMRTTSESAASFARFLLEQGANPNIGFNKVTPGKEKGALLTQKWLGETWDELVKRTRTARAKKELEGRNDSDEDDEYDEDWGKPRAKRRKTTKRKSGTGRVDVVVVSSDDEEGDDETY